MSYYIIGGLVVILLFAFVLSFQIADYTYKLNKMNKELREKYCNRLQFEIKMVDWYSEILNNIKPLCYPYSEKPPSFRESDEWLKKIAEWIEDNEKWKEKAIKAIKENE